MQDVLTNYEREISYSNVDPTLSFKLGKSSDVIKERRSMKIVVEQGAAAYTENDTIRFKIGGDFIDSESLYFTCEYEQSVLNGAAASAGSTAGGPADTSKCRPPNGIAGLIQEVRIRSGTGVELETIRHQNLLHHVPINYSHTPNHMTTLHLMAGGGEKTMNDSTGEVDHVDKRPMGEAAATKETFSFHIVSGLLNCGKLLPCQCSAASSSSWSWTPTPTCSAPPLTRPPHTKSPTRKSATTTSSCPRATASLC
jgi:hypothetical protein